MKRLLGVVVVSAVVVVSTGFCYEEIALLRFSDEAAVAICRDQRLPILTKTDDFALCILREHWLTDIPDAAGRFLVLMTCEKQREYYLVSPAASRSLAENSFGIDFMELPNGSFLLAIDTNLGVWPKLGKAEVVRLGNGVTYLTERTEVKPVRQISRDPDPRIEGMAAQVTESGLTVMLADLVGFVSRNSFYSGCAQAADYVYDAFMTYGLEASYHDHTGVMAPSVIGELRGVDTPDRIYIICGHLDSTAGSAWTPEANAPGADDNGTGSVAVLAAASILSQYRFESTLRFVCFTGEEQGLYGSEAYAAMASDDGEDIRGVINYDMIGWVEPSPEDLEVICNEASSAFTDNFIVAASTYTSLATVKVINGNMASSDHYPFWQYDYYAFCGIEDFWPVYPYYHTTNDTIDKIDMPFFTEVTKASVAALAAFAIPVDENILYLSHVVDDSSGDNDGVMDPGETVQISVYLYNYRSILSENVQAVLSCTIGSEFVRLDDDLSQFGDLEPNGSANNAGNPYMVTILATAPEETVLSFALTVTAAGGYQTVLGFSEVVTGALEVCPIYSEPMLTDPGWSISGGSWAFGAPTGQGGSSGEPDPTAGYDGAYVYGYNLNGDYTNNMVEYHLTTHSFDCSDYFDVHLKFKRWLGIESSAYDHAYVRASIDGSNWTTIWENTSSALNAGQWVSVDYDISSVADLQAAVYIRWTIGVTDRSRTCCGWNIDEVEICGSTFPQATPTATPILTPTPVTTVTPQCIRDGDVVDDGALSAGDAQRAFLIVLELYVPTTFELCAADCNGDDVITAGDAQRIFAAAAGMDSCVDPLAKVLMR